VLFAALALYLLLLIARHHEPQRHLPLLRFGLALLALPLCGGAGIAMGPLLAIWLIGLSALIYRSGEMGSKRRAALAAGFGLALFALVAAYFNDYARPEHFSPASSWKGAMLVTTRFLGGGFGSGSRYWPDTGLVAIALVFFTAWVLARTLLVQREEFPRAAGLAAFLAGCAGLAFAVGWGRSGYTTETGHESKYFVFSMLVVCCAYFAWMLCDWPVERRRGVCLSAMLLVLLTVPGGSVAAKAHGRSVRAVLTAYERDVQAGLPLDAMAAKHVLFPPNRKKYAANGHEMLQRIGHGAMAKRR
jgi:hypothetical protein